MLHTIENTLFHFPNVSEFKIVILRQMKQITERARLAVTLSTCTRGYSVRILYNTRDIVTGFRNIPYSSRQIPGQYLD
jgi:hypothetical protein